ncbi:MAG: glutathione S-transferase N-terminal domain-containing protein [Myxococcota bacterium]
MQRSLDVVTSIGATLARAAQGMRVGQPGPRPKEPLLLYEFEACPYCRKVREALTALDLDADVRPCPKGGRRYRPELIARGGKAQFPYLVDPNTGDEMYESDAIVRHLYAEYGVGPPPAILLGALPVLSGSLASALRLGRGAQVESSRAPERPLELWSFEASPFCRIVREKLCTLELPYRLHNVGKGSAGREAFVARSGKMQVPYLEDPNTGQALFESAEIVAYLERRYAER